MGSKIKGIILVVLILGVVVYLFTASSFSKGIGSLLSFPSGTTLFANGSSSPSSWFGVGSGPTYPPVIAQGTPPAGYPQTVSNPTTGNTNIAPADIPAGFTLAQLSPYFHEVRLGSVSAGTAYYYGTITLYAYPPQNETVDITGWQVKSRDSGEYIPQAIDLYDPSGLTAPTDIRVKNGDDVYLYSSSAPFNLRINECTGYIAHVATFTPQLPENCPQLDYSKIQNFTGQCQNYIESLGGCAQPDMSSLQIPRNDYACQDYLENNFTYRSCFDAHEADANFLSDQVWVWTGGNVVDPYHDNVELLDRNGLLVDELTY